MTAHSVLGEAEAVLPGVGCKALTRGTLLTDGRRRRCDGFPPARVGAVRAYRQVSTLASTAR